MAPSIATKTIATVSDTTPITPLRIIEEVSMWHPIIQIIPIIITIIITDMAVATLYGMVGNL